MNSYAYKVFTLKAVSIIEMELDVLESVRSLAQRVGVHQNRLQQGFQKFFSLSINGYIKQERLKQSELLVKGTTFTMREIMERIGLTSQSYFSKIFKDKFGCSPTDYRVLSLSINPE